MVKITSLDSLSKLEIFKSPSPFTYLTWRMMVTATIWGVSTYHEPGTELTSDINILSHLILTSLKDKYYYPYFTNEGTEAETG